MFFVLAPLYTPLFDSSVSFWLYFFLYQLIVLLFGFSLFPLLLAVFLRAVCMWYACVCISPYMVLYLLANRLLLCFFILDGAVWLS